MEKEKISVGEIIAIDSFVDCTLVHLNYGTVIKLPPGCHTITINDRPSPADIPMTAQIELHTH